METSAMDETALESHEQVTQCCASCGSANVRNDRVRSAFWHQDRLVVVEDIPALICSDCHEQSFDDRTVVLLDLLRGGGFPTEEAHSELRVPVFSLRDRGRAVGDT
jgi:YgiT-type zinc finger domain-containing protein